MHSAARVIIFDTETTGLSPAKGDRIVEIGAVELIGFQVGRTFHRYLNPERDVPDDVVRVHGLTGHFLSDKPLFAQVSGELLAFFGTDAIVAHNAAFDRAFLNAELERCGLEPTPEARFVDTLAMARAKLRAGARLSLDGLCKHYRLDQRGFDLAARKGAGGHGALLDAQMLAEIYIELMGGRVQELAFVSAAAAQIIAAEAASAPRARARLAPLPLLSTDAERGAHQAFADALPGGNAWRSWEGVA
jgi:DNA polymerase-3 subunit epsilon